MTALRVALIAVGLDFIFGIYLQGLLWPSGWKWGHVPSHYPAMLMGVYATLGVFLLIAARNPLAHRGLIWFTIASSAVHGVIMAIEASTDPGEHSHLAGDVLTQLVVAVVLAGLMLRVQRPQSTGVGP